jgi:uncharacterized LabA/DUF88 family protein
MFNPKTEKIKKLSEIFFNRIKELENIFDSPTNIYIDWANIIYWQDKLNWHFDWKRLKQLFDSFENISSIKFYRGVIKGDKKCEKEISELEKYNYDLRKKPVKMISISIDISSIPNNSPSILGNFIKKPLLKKYEIETIEYLNKKFKELNERGIYKIEDKKCNFDVEMSNDMIIDFKENEVKNFVLWSADSDFADSIERLLDKNKKVVLFSTSRRLTNELNDLRKKGLESFEIKKIKDFICWNKEIPKEIKEKL